MWRTWYNLLGWEYIGKKEQNQIERQRRLKYLTCEQIKKSNMQLNPGKMLLLDKLISKRNNIQQT